MVEPANSGSGSQRQVIVGKISGIYGVSGWVRVHSYTRPVENIFSYAHWLIGRQGDWKSRKLLEGKKHGKGLIARLDEIDDRDIARSLIGKDIALNREQMPDLPAGQYYWCDLLGIDVVNQDGINLGKVVEIQETGANDVLIVEGKKRHLIPLIVDRYVLDIDMNNARIKVDWDPEYT